MWNNIHTAVWTPKNSVSVTGIFAVVLNCKMCLQVRIKFQTALRECTSAPGFTKIYASWSSLKMLHRWMSSPTCDAFRSFGCRRPEQQWSSLHSVSSCDTLQRESVKCESFARVPIFLRIPSFKSFGYWVLWPQF